MFELNGFVDGIEKLRAENERLRAENKQLNELVEKKDRVIKFRVDGQNVQSKHIQRLETVIEDALEIASAQGENMKMQPWDFLMEAVDDGEGG